MRENEQGAQESKQAEPDHDDGRVEGEMVMSDGSGQCFVPGGGLAEVVGFGELVDFRRYVVFRHCMFSSTGAGCRDNPMYENE